MAAVFFVMLHRCYVCYVYMMLTGNSCKGHYMNVMLYAGRWYQNNMHELTVQEVMMSLQDAKVHQYTFFLHIFIFI